MKKNQIVIGVILLAIVSITSCQKEESRYSCDPEVNNWASLNAVEIKSMNRSQFLDLDEIYQRAAYNVFTPQQRMSLWKVKLEETLQLEWTVNEHNHIENLLNMIVKNIQWFNNDRGQETMDHFEIECYKWFYYAINNLQWDVETVYAIVGVPAPVAKDNGKLLLVSSQSGGGKGIPQKICSCTLYCTISNINCGKDQSCNDEDCEWPTTVGCGWLWMDSCNGYCGKNPD